STTPASRASTGRARRSPRARRTCWSRSGRRSGRDHRSPVKPFFVYMLRCADGTYYLGHTDELELRVSQHQEGEIPGYTHDRRPVSLVWSQETATREEALTAERQLKGWSRAKKEALIAGDWNAISVLGRGGASTSSARTEAVAGGGASTGSAR